MCLSPLTALPQWLADFTLTLTADHCLVLQARSGGRGELQEARTLMTQLKTERDALRAQLDVIQVQHTYCVLSLFSLLLS